MKQRSGSGREAFIAALEVAPGSHGHWRPIQDGILITFP